MFKGEFADTCANNFRSNDGGTSNHVKSAQTGSKDPFQFERKFLSLFLRSFKFLTPPGGQNGGGSANIGNLNVFFVTRKIAI